LPAPSSSSSRIRVYIGTYTGSGSRGIYLSHVDPVTGAFSSPELVAETPNPSYLCSSPDRRIIIAVNENSPGSVTSFAVSEESGKLEQLSTQSSGGSGPCYVSLSQCGGYVFVSNYGDGTVAVLPLSVDGILGKICCEIKHTGAGPDPKRQSGPHVHQTLSSPDGRFAIAVELGTDSIYTYAFDRQSGELSRHDPVISRLPPRTGPRHLAFHPSLKVAYLTAELSNEIFALSYDESTGAFSVFESITASNARVAEINYPAEVAVHSSGEYLFVSNRGDDNISCFSINGRDGNLSARGSSSSFGNWPRHFALSCTDELVVVANQKSNNLVSCRFNAEADMMLSMSVNISVISPVCVLFL
jgi:6-phosphogluconolactonase